MTRQRCHSLRMRAGFRAVTCLASAVAAAIAAGASPCFGQCEYEVTAIIEGQEICGFWGRPHVNGWDLSDNGIVAGEWHCLIGPNHAFIWRREGPPIDLPMPEGTKESEVAGVNELGHCVGWLHNGVPGNAGHAFFCDGQTTQTFLPPPEGNYTTANAIGPDDTIVGYWGNTVDGDVPDQACLWRDGQLISLGAILGTPKSRAADINDAGLITGWMGNAMIHDAHGFVWDGEEVLDIGVIAGGYTAVPRAINNCGEVCGTGYIEDDHPSGFVRHGFFWDGGQMHDIGTIPPFRESFGYDVSDYGQVVGYLYLQNHPYHAFLWQDGAMFDLNDLVTPDLDAHLDGARAINNEGQIMTTGMSDSGRQITILLTPRDRPPSDLDCDCDTDLEDLEILLAHWGEVGGEADINDDGIVNVRDLLELLANWG
jgi:chitinase